MRFCLIGAGEIGCLRARSVALHPDTELVGVADPDEERARRAAAGSGARIHRNPRKLLESEPCEAVIVSTPVQHHEQIILAALDSCKHVLCEKPLSNTVESCRRILMAAQERGVTISVGFNHRYYPSFRYLKQVIDEGRIGALDRLRILGAHDGLANFQAEWMYRKETLGGGAMMDVGIHMTDLARFVLGEIDEVYGVAAGNVWRVPGSEDRALALFKSPSGVPALYEATWNEWKGYRVYLEAYGDAGMVRAQYAPMFNLLITQDRPGAKRRREYRLYPGIAIREKLRGWQSTTLQTFQDELEDLLARMDGRSVPLADGWSGLRAVEIAHALYESSASGEPVRLSPRPE